jgi:hypothetical protein
MSFFSILSRSRADEQKRMADLLHCVKQGYAFASSTAVFAPHAMRDPAFEAWRVASERLIAQCEGGPEPASPHAHRLLNDILSATADPRCDTLKALSIAILLVEESGEGPWPQADRALFLSVVPYGDASHKFLAMQHGTSFDDAHYAHMFVLLGAQPSPQAAAVLCAVLYRDLQDEGRHTMALALAAEVRRRLQAQPHAA